MSPIQKPDLAEAADRRWQLLAAAMLLIGCKAGISAASVLVEPSVRTYLDWAEIATALAAVAVVGWLLFFKFMKVPAHLRHRFLNMEGFVASTVHKAFKVSWLATFMALTLLAPASRRFITIPGEFFMQSLLALMLGVFSVAFFVMNASGDESDGHTDA